jgi:glyoxylase-like metal-dependent hydrolase (beta-lactamase superfamily II)
MHRVVLPGVAAVFFPRAVVNAFVVNADVLTLIDTGTPGGAAAILDAIRAIGREPSDLRRILLTHRHADHAGNAAELAGATGAPVLVSPVEAPFVREGAEQPKPSPATPMGRLLVPYVKVALPWALPPLPVEEELRDDEVVGSFRVIATPGHTAGHVSLLWEERGLLFAGDAAANLTGVGPHPAADDPVQARDSFSLLGRHEFESAVFGHGRTVRSRRQARSARPPVELRRRVDRRCVRDGAGAVPAHPDLDCSHGFPSSRRRHRPGSPRARGRPDPRRRDPLRGALLPAWLRDPRLPGVRRSGRPGRVTPDAGGAARMPLLRARRSRP